MNITDKISVLGDSILKGVIFDEVSKKYKFIKDSAVNLFTTNNGVVTKNYSKFGCTTKKALEILPTLLEKENTPHCILLEFGGNDCDYNWDEVCQNPELDHEPNVPFEEFKQHLSELIMKIKSAHKIPFVMSLPPIDSDRYFNWISKNCEERAQKLLAFLKEKNLIYRHQELYSRALEAVARKHKLYVVNVRDAFLSIKNYTDYLCLDGIHPNEKGQQIIRQVFDQNYKIITAK